jgi:chorismate mutase-like protein
MLRSSRLPRLSAAFVAALGLMLLAGCSLMQSHRSKDLPDLVVERLGWMHEVAHIKQRHHLPVTDPKREAELLAAMTAKGVAAGLPADATRRFFAGQITAAKIFQEQWMKRMSRPKASLSSPADLAKIVRPALDDIGTRMIEALVVARQRHDHRQIIEQTRTRLQRAGHGPEVTGAALAGVEAGLGASE